MDLVVKEKKGFYQKKEKKNRKKGTQHEMKTTTWDFYSSLVADDICDLKQKEISLYLEQKLKHHIYPNKDINRGSMKSVFTLVSF